MAGKLHVLRCIYNTSQGFIQEFCLGGEKEMK